MATAALVAREFVAEESLSRQTFEEITEVRVNRPQAVEQEARKRRQRRRLTRDGRLVLVALDHPARGVTRIREDELALGNRHELLARTLRVLADPDLDGVVATADILEELLILSHLARRKHRGSFLDGRVLVGTMNRGGLAGTAFEMDDRFTGCTAARLAELQCDGGKMLYRLDAEDAASGRTIAACAEAVNALRRHRLPAFLEALGVARSPDGGYRAMDDAVMLVKSCGIAAGLGESSTHVWLKLPYCADFAAVGQATTLPILLLGGPARANPRDTLSDFASAIASSPRVRGAIIGRNLLFPGPGDPLPMCRALTAIVHRGSTLHEAVRILEAAPSAESARKAKRRRAQ
ncbi:MAG TPA: deoxyribose-phosphate aldolase [Terriglobia bacterium]|nr:deoxyribose-phosphate aldolase [Terriglobia bacterium]